MTGLPDVKPLRDLIGYGSELADALDRYSAATPDKKGEADKQAILKAWQGWMSHCPHATHLCFADITFFSADLITVRDALTIVITPRSGPSDDENHRSYLRALKEKYLASGSTMAPHEVFAAGLPYRLEAGERVAPETASQLKAFWKKTVIEHHHVESSVLVSQFPPLDQEPINWKPAAQVDFFVDQMRTYDDKERYTQSFAAHVSEKPVSDQWKKWQNVFDEERKRGALKSTAGGSPSWLVAAPVVNRNDHDPSDYTLVACIFLGFDAAISSEELAEALRYILLHLYEANATSWAVRRGEIRGKNLAIIPASHELKNVVEALVPGVSDRAMHLLHGYFRQMLGTSLDSSHKIVPISLSDLLSDQLTRAASLEKMAVLAASGHIAPGAAAYIDEQIDAHVALVEQNTTCRVPQQLAVLSTRQNSADFFEMATLCALRNAIKHTFHRSRPKLTLSVEETAISEKKADGYEKITQTLFLILRNTFSRNQETSDVVVPETGTLGALRRYVRAYEVDPRKVTIRRIDYQIRPSKDKAEQIEETWETTLPVPESHSAL